MQIRALTGFDSQTLEKYGRSYSPMNGCSPGLGGFDIPYEIPSYVPPQKIEMLDPKTGKKKIFTIQNIQQLILLITQGFMLFGNIKGSGKQTVQGPEPTGPQLKTKNESTSLNFAGFNITTIVGVTIAAIFLTRLMKK